MSLPQCLGNNEVSLPVSFYRLYFVSFRRPCTADWGMTLLCCEKVSRPKLPQFPIPSPVHYGSSSISSLPITLPQWFLPRLLHFRAVLDPGIQLSWCSSLPGIHMFPSWKTEWYSSFWSFMQAAAHKEPDLLSKSWNPVEFYFLEVFFLL